MEHEDKKILETEVATLFYIEKLSQKEISMKLDLSRASISRLLARAEEDGIVSISVRSTLTKQPLIASQIKHKYSLDNVYIAETSHELEITKRNIASLVANAIVQWLEPDTFLGVAAGRFSYYVSKVLQNPGNIHMDTVQMIGNGYGIIQSIEGSRLVNLFSTKLLGIGHVINAPLMVSNKQTRDMLLREPTIKETLSLFKKIQIGLFDIETVMSSLSYQLSEPWISKADALQLKETKAIGSVASLYFDANGESCSVGINDRRIGISMNEIATIPHSVAMACSNNMLEATKAILASHIINTLVIDEVLARALI